MCTLVARKFPNIGWVGVKNRDRPAPTRTELVREEIDGIERVTLVDEDTMWSEGTNSHGVSIISSSLHPARLGTVLHLSPDGIRIREALSKGTVSDAVTSLIQNQVSGCVMVFDADQMWLIEGQENTHQQVAREIKQDHVVRTNHGIWLPQAGYQPNQSDPILKKRRISSEARLMIGEYIASVAQTPADIVTLLAKTWSTNPQLNTLRKPLPPIETRTTEQLLIEPSQLRMLVRNVDGMLDFDQVSANPPGSQVLIGII